MRHIFKKSLFGGTFLTGVLAIDGWNYCMGGTAYGRPLAMYRPSHGDSFGTFLLESRSMIHGSEISLVAVSGNLFYLSFATLLILYLCSKGVSLYSKVIHSNFCVEKKEKILK